MKLFILFLILIPAKQNKDYTPSSFHLVSNKYSRNTVYLDRIIAKPQNKELQASWVNAYLWTDKEWSRYRKRNLRFLYFRNISNRVISDDSVLDLKKKLQ